MSVGCVPKICSPVAKLKAQIKQLQARLVPAEFFLTEILSLEQVLPLDLRNEANVIIDKVMAEIDKWEVANKALKEFRDNVVAINSKVYTAFMALNLGLGGEPLLRKKLVELNKVCTKTEEKDATDGKEDTKP